MATPFLKSRERLAIGNEIGSERTQSSKSSSEISTTRDDAMSCRLASELTPKAGPTAAQRGQECQRLTIHTGELSFTKKRAWFHHSCRLVVPRK